VNYVLGPYDGKRVYPRQKPSHARLWLSLPSISQVREAAAAFTAYYQSTEWDRTEGWSVYERVILVDEDARSVPVENPPVPRQGPIETAYVVLMHQLPKPIAQRRDGKSPISCFETKGDILQVVLGKNPCTWYNTHPPPVKHKWRGEICLCGYKIDSRGKRVPKVVRGSHDVNLIYQTVDGVVNTIT
jgi:hypothetical protein